MRLELECIKLGIKVGNWERYVIENEVAGIEFSELDGFVLLDHLLENADVLVFRNFDYEECVSFVAEEVAAERQEWHDRAGDWCLDICSRSAQVRKEFKKRTSGSSYQNVDVFIFQSLAEN